MDDVAPMDVMMTASLSRPYAKGESESDAAARHEHLFQLT
jgi:hypothetical protein